jgi:cytochrome c
MKQLNGTHIVASFILLISTALVSAETLTIKLPAETVKLRSSTMAGYTLATQRCLICHSADYIEYQPPAMPEKKWLAEVNKMQHAYGAPITDDEAKQIAAYLASAYTGKAAPTQ